jgi:hypothetical protein
MLALRPMSAAAPAQLAERAATGEPLVFRLSALLCTPFFRDLGRPAAARLTPAPAAPAACPSPAGTERPTLPQLITTEAICLLESELDHGSSIAALRRFNAALRALPAASWEARLAPVMAELAYNLESFNPAFTAVLLKVQSTIGRTDYVRRDQALKRLIQPLAGEYGMHNGQPQAATHRELFSLFYADLLRAPLEAALAAAPRPAASELLFAQMMRDLSEGGAGDKRGGGGGAAPEPVELASYALGYNLAIEYLADYEKTWMLDSFRALDARVLAPAGRALREWVFLEVHAEGEAEHAALGHAAVAGLVPASHEPVLRRAMLDHDRDFAAFYNRMAEMLE